MKIRLYLDEDVDVALASALRQRGIDVLTTQEAGKRQQTDEAQLEYAVQAGRVFFTHNRGDFARLHVMGVALCVISDYPPRTHRDRGAGGVVSMPYPLRSPDAFRDR
jgi:uncharacterized protein with PIN domain